ncbi:MAG: hypothetical protein AMS27_15945 [Bacteroides sp. SM23_62_1]|nr:MAG: hypothetical protein AMS27_15945 [Bacteroides sp. SM23_62_1]
MADKDDMKLYNPEGRQGLHNKHLLTKSIHKNQNDTPCILNSSSASVSASAFFLNESNISFL